MIITAPVTDYIPASVLTTHGDLVERGAANPERLAAAAAGLVLKATGVGATPAWLPHYLADTGIHIGNNTRNTAGAQVITGVGFTLSIVIFFACDDNATDANFSQGASDGSVDMCTYALGDAGSVLLDTSHCIYIDNTGGAHIEAAVSAIGGDGFTLTWTLTGLRGCDFMYICLP